MTYFNSSRAWEEAIKTVQANREVLLTLGCVFFLLPGLATTLLFSDMQEKMVSAWGNKSAAQALIQANFGPILIIGGLSLILQLIGNCAILSLLTDRDRPTVRETLQIALRTLPTAFGALVLFFGGYLSATLIFTVIADALGQIAGFLISILIVGFIAFFVYASVRFSLTLPVIIADKISNPIAALRRSWELTRHIAWQLLLFFGILLIVYAIIMMLLGGGLTALATLILGQGLPTLLVSSLLTGLLGTITGVIFMAVLAAVHRQIVTQSPSHLTF